MSEFRELNKNCYCGAAGAYRCKRCSSKKYCSRECQRRDWPLHKRQCANEAVITTVIENRSTDLDLVAQHRELMKQPHWQRWLEIAYVALRAKVGDSPAAGTTCVYWIGIENDSLPIAERPTVPVAFAYIAEEPQHLYMHVVNVQNLQAEPDIDGRRKAVLLDEDCVVFDTDPDRRPQALLYPLNIDIPTAFEVVVNWQLQQR